MSKNILIVESKNDQYFIEALLTHMRISNVDVGTPICSVDDFECLEGISKLGPRLVELRERIEKDDIQRVGIILDADSEGVEKRVSLIDKELKKIGADVVLDTVNKFVRSEKLDVEFACCITHVEGSGELETLLRRIASEDRTYANCLQSWQTCLKAKDKGIKQKEFDKFWVSIYQRYDTCSTSERKQAKRKCTAEIAMKKSIWNFEHEALNDLKAFLQLFKD